jgi:accessory gene regulator B
MGKAMVESIALRFAEAIKRANPERTASIAVLKFSLVAILNTLITFTIIGSVGLATGSFGETLMGLIAFVLIRYFSGGFHLHNALHCSILSIILLSVAPHIYLSDLWTTIIVFVSMILLGIFAPSNIEGHARIPKKYFPVLKIAAVLVATSNLFIGSPTIALVYLFQAISTIRIKKGVRK